MTPAEVIEKVLAEAAGMSRPAYRGQAVESWKPLSGAVRRLCGAYGDDVLAEWNESELRKLVSDYQREQLLLPVEMIDREQTPRSGATNTGCTLKPRVRSSRS